MKLLLSSLLLASLCALSSWSVSLGALAVSQVPDVSAMEGEAVNITCCWTVMISVTNPNPNPNPNPISGRVYWLKNKTRIKTEFISGNDYSQGSLKNKTNDCSTLIFPNITREDAGRYTCKVYLEIPLLSVAEGNGTVITVLFKDNMGEGTEGGSTSSPPIPVIVALAVVVPLLFITLTCFCSLRRKQAQAARVIYEVPHIDSEVAEVDKHSTSSSRGSSEWCQVPVYESFDYFERMEDKGSG